MNNMWLVCMCINGAVELNRRGTEIPETETFHFGCNKIPNDRGRNTRNINYVSHAAFLLEFFVRQ